MRGCRASNCSQAKVVCSAGRPLNASSPSRKPAHWLDGLALSLTIGASALTLLPAFHSVLPLPQELELKGWVFIILAGSIAIWLAIQIRASRDTTRGLLLLAACMCLLLGLLVFPVLFWVVDRWWKVAPPSFADRACAGVCGTGRCVLLRLCGCGEFT